MDPPPTKSSSPLPNKKVSRARLIITPLLSILAIVLIIGLYIWMQQRGVKARNLEETVLQELKQPQQIALNAVAADEAAKAVLGEDVKATGGLTRAGSGELDRTNTLIHFDIAGSKGTGRVTASAAQKQGAWQITAPIHVKLASGKTLEVPKPSDKPPDIEF